MINLRNANVCKFVSIGTVCNFRGRRQHEMHFVKESIMIMCCFGNEQESLLLTELNQHQDQGLVHSL